MSQKRGSAFSLIVGGLLESLLELEWELLVALSANRLHVELDKLVLERELAVATSALEAVHAP